MQRAKKNWGKIMHVLTPALIWLNISIRKSRASLRLCDQLRAGISETNPNNSHSCNHRTQSMPSSITSMSIPHEIGTIWCAIRNDWLSLEGMTSAKNCRTHWRYPWHVSRLQFQQGNRRSGQCGSKSDVGTTACPAVFFKIPVT